MLSKLWVGAVIWACGGSAQASPSVQGDSGAAATDASQGMHGLSFSSGGYSDSVQFEVPAGVAGHAPTVGLSYAQGLPDGPVGKGWALNAGSQITRNSSAGGGMPEQGGTGSDTFFLNGQELHLVTTAIGSWYEPEHWDGSKATYNGASNTWSVVKDGTVWTYGLAVTIDPGAMYSGVFRDQTASWMLTEVRDRFGNVVQYEYTQPNTSSSALASQYGVHTGEVLLSRVHWGAAEVLFNYELRPNGESTITYRPGRREVREHRLADVDIRLGGQPYAAYDLVYFDEGSAYTGTTRNTPVSLLREIVRTNTAPGGSDLRIRSMDYNHTEGDTWTLGAGVDYTSQLGRGNSDAWENKIQVLLSPSLNGDAFSDVLRVEYSCDSEVGSGAVTRGGRPVGGMLQAGVYTASCSPKVSAWINQATPISGGWGLYDPYLPSFSASDPIAQDYATKLQKELNETGSGTKAGYGQPLAQGTHWSLTDLNGDGRPEIVIGSWDKGAGAMQSATYWTYSPYDCDPSDTIHGCWESDSLGLLSSNPGSGSSDQKYGWKNVQFVDVDGDGLLDIVQRPLTWGEDFTEDTDDGGGQLDDDPLAGDPSSGPSTSVSGLPEYHYGELIDRDDSFWYRNNGDFTFSGFRSLELPLEDSSRWTAEFTALSGACSDVPTVTLGVLNEHEYRESQGTLSDYNGDGIADVAYSYYTCGLSVSHGHEQGDPSSIYSEIFWGDGRGGFVPSGLSAGKPNMVYESHPHPSSHGFLADSWTYKPHHAAIDLNRSGRPELVNARSDETLGYSKFINLVEGFDLIDDHGTPVGDVTTSGTSNLENADSTDPLGAGNLPILGSQVPWVEASTTGDFDGNGFPDLLLINASVDSAAQVTWSVEMQLSDRDESYGVLKSVRSPFGGVTDLTWASSARVGHNDQLHYTREVIAQVERGYEDPITLRYFKGEHALGRFRGFGMVEVTRGGATTEYGYATAPHIERRPVSVASYRSDGTLESAQVTGYGVRVGTGVFWDLLPPYENPVSQTCSYEVGHGTGPIGNRIQTVDMDDLVAMCFDTVSAEEWIGGNGWAHEVDPDDPISTVVESVWEVGEDTIPEYGTSGLSGFGDVPNAFTPDGQADEGHVYASEVTSDGLLTGTSRPADPSWVGETFPSPSGPTEVWEYTKIFSYTKDIDGDGATDLLLERVDDLGLTDVPSGFLTSGGPYGGTLASDDTYVESVYSARWVGDWGFSLVSRTQGAGSTVDSHQRFENFVALDVPTKVMDCGNDPSCGASHDSYFYYHTGGSISGTLFGIDDSEGHSTTWTVDSSGPCVGMVLEEIDAEGRVRTFGRDSRCRVDLEDWEGSTTTTTYDGLNRKEAVTHSVENVDGSISTIEQFHAYSRNRAGVGTLVQAASSSGGGISLPVFRVSEQTLDSFGRVIRSNVCTANAVSCLSPSGDQVRTSTTYGSDGRRFGQYGPMSVNSGEVPVSFTEYSATGRVVATHQSDHDVANVSWRTTQMEYHPREQRVTDPLGTLHESYADPLESYSIVAGVDRGSAERDAFGRTTRSIGADGKEVEQSYDGYGNLEFVKNGATANCMSATGGGGSCTYQVDYTYDSLGRLTEEMGPDGTQLRYAYDGLGRVVTEHFVDLGGGSTLLKEFIYTSYAPGALPSVAEIDAETGAVVQVEVDGLGRTQRQSDLSGSTTWSFGDLPEATAVQDVDGLILSFEYDDLGRLTRKNLGLGSSATLIEQYAYNPAGQVVSTTDADGVVLDVEYTLTGLPLRSSIPSGAGQRILLSEASYDALGRVTSAHQSGVDSFYEYDALGRVERLDVGARYSTAGGYVLDGVVGGTEYSQLWTYTAGDQVDTETLEPVHTGSGTTQHTYDAWGRLIGTLHPDGGTESFDYDVNGFLRMHTDVVGASAEWRYSDRGELEYHKPKNQAASTYAHMAFSGGRSLQVTDPLGFTSTQHTDGLGRLVQQDDPNGASVEYIYSGSRLTEELLRDSSGGLTARRNHGYESSTGRLASTWEWHDPADLVYDPTTHYALQYQYSPAGRVEESGNPNELTQFVYGVDGLLMEEIWDESSQLQLYDDLVYSEGGVDYYSPLLTGTDTLPTLSGVGAVSVPVVTAGGNRPLRSEDFYYDGAARIVGRTTYLGTGVPGMSADSVDVQSYDLDAMGNPLETEVNRSVPLSPSLLAGSNLTQWTYDAMGRPLTRDTLTTMGTSHSASTAWGWNADGSLASVDTPSGQSITYHRGGPTFELDRIDLNGSTVVTVNARDVLGRITAATTGSTSQTFGYDGLGRLDSRTMTDALGTSTWTAFFTDNGQLESEQVSDYTGNSWTNDYTYFEEGWLKSETRGATGETRQYTYDSGGRRTQTYVNGVLERATNWAGSRVVDVDGVVVDYDGQDGVELDHLDYAYERDATGRVAAMYDGSSGTTLYQMMRDEAGRVIALEDGAGTRRQTTWGLGIGGLPWEVADGSGSTLNYLRAEGIVFAVADGTNAVPVMTDGAGSLLQVGSDLVEVGTAFGESPALSSTDARFAFAGLEMLPDAPGVQMSQQRMYDAETGRFLSPDPIGLGGGNHRTRYGSGNPTRYTDPTGYHNWDAFMVGSENYASDWSANLPAHGGSEAHLYFQPETQYWIRDSWSGSSMRMWYDHLEGMDQMKMELEFTNSLIASVLGGPATDSGSPSAFGDRIRRGIGQVRDWAYERWGLEYQTLGAALFSDPSDAIHFVHEDGQQPRQLNEPEFRSFGNDANRLATAFWQAFTGAAIGFADHLTRESSFEGAMKGGSEFLPLGQRVVVNELAEQAAPIYAAPFDLIRDDVAMWADENLIAPSYSESPAAFAAGNAAGNLAMTAAIVAGAPEVKGGPVGGPRSKGVPPTSTGPLQLTGPTVKSPQLTAGKVGHATPWNAMSSKQKKAFQHSVSRHGGELGIPNFAGKQAPKIQAQFNSVVGHIRSNGVVVKSGRKPFNGSTVDVRFFSAEFHGKKYYYYETLDGQFISAGVQR